MCMDLKVYEYLVKYFINLMLYFFLFSRKRGPLSGAGFICAKDEKSFLSICQANLADIPFFPGDETLLGCHCFVFYVIYIFLT